MLKPYIFKGNKIISFQAMNMLSYELFLLLVSQHRTITNHSYVFALHDNWLRESGHEKINTYQTQKCNNVKTHNRFSFANEKVP